MMLPFLSATVAIWFGLRGNRRRCLWAWLATLVIYVAWCKLHMTDPLNLSF